MTYKNNKTGNLYRYLAMADNESNLGRCERMMVYCPDDNEHSIFVMNEVEFCEKFELV